MWLLKKLRPDHKPIATFRRDHLQPLRQVCRAFTLLCKQMDLFSGELVAIDGSKFKAVIPRRTTVRLVGHGLSNCTRNWRH